MILLAKEMRLLGRDVRERDVEGALHTMDDDEGRLSALLALATYYDAAAHTDLVYRVLLHLEANEDAAGSTSRGDRASAPRDSVGLGDRVSRQAVRSHRLGQRVRRSGAGEREGR
jgi:hypothetical protein